MTTVEELKRKYQADDTPATKQSLAAVNEFDKLLGGIETTVQNIVKVAIPQVQRVPITRKPLLVDKLRKLYGKLTTVYLDIGHLR